MNTSKLILILLSIVFVKCKSDVNTEKSSSLNTQSVNSINLPSLIVNGENTHDIVRAYRIAIGDVVGNIQHHQSGILDQKLPCMYAGLFYGKPWTRDAAINVWNGLGMLSPIVAKNTLLAQVKKGENGEIAIRGQYWDKIIWTIGAWDYYLYSGDNQFLKLAYTAAQNTILQLEKDEFSPKLGLYRGPAVYGDGVSAYPERYTHHQTSEKTGSYSGIYHWAQVNDSLKNPNGYGMPMHALSTNAVYYQSYQLLSRMAEELNKETTYDWNQKADHLLESINQHFWNDNKKNYNYLIDSFGNCDAQESLGIAFCLLFDIATNEQVENIFKTTHIEPAGIPCVYPSFKRYRNETLDTYGRHSGTVWPHVQGFWADAAMKYHYHDSFLHEFNALTRHALRDFQFVEIYHPTKETPYGGVQEPSLENWEEWFCAERQTWSATAYLRMIFKNIIGLNISNKGIAFNPFLTDEIENISLLGLKYRNSILNISISGSGDSIESFYINGKKTDNFYISSDSTGKISIKIKLMKK